MEAWVNEQLKNLQKNLEKICVQTIGKVSSQKAYLDQQQVQQQEKRFSNSRSSFHHFFCNLKTAFTGNYGRKINEVLKEQQQDVRGMSRIEK